MTCTDTHPITIDTSNLVRDIVMIVVVAVIASPLAIVILGAM